MCPEREPFNLFRWISNYDHSVSTANVFEPMVFPPSLGEHPNGVVGSRLVKLPNGVTHFSIPLFRFALRFFHLLKNTVSQLFLRGFCNLFNNRVASTWCQLGVNHTFHFIDGGLGVVRVNMKRSQFAVKGLALWPLFYLFCPLLSCSFSYKYELPNSQTLCFDNDANCRGGGGCE
jgi:hypothetical protein